jgi:hypothetical protein
LDTLFSELIRSKGKCERCGKKETLATAHIFSRRNFSTRWDKNNALCLCFACHFHFAHKEVMLFADWVRERMGDKEYKLLKYRAMTPVHGQDLKLIEIYLKQELKKLYA